MSLYDKCRVSTNTEGEDTFVGIEYDKDVCITFPVGYDIPQDERELKKDILLLLKSFSLTKSSQKKSVDSGTSYLDNYKLPINAYFWLINDYLKNGLYKSRERIIRQNSHGKINWRKTIQKTQPVISNNGFVYLEPFYEITRNTDTVITEIQKYCLGLFDTMFGWLFGEAKAGLSMYNDRHVSVMKGLLQKEMMISYSDYKKTLLNNLYSILNGLDDETIKTKAYAYGSNRYDVVWQNLIDAVFGNEDVSKYYPKTSWDLRIPVTGKGSGHLEQDTIYHDRNTGKYYILDAKYYKAYQDDNPHFPPATDIEKQITYGQELHKGKGIDPSMIYNALILPYNKNDNRFGLSGDIEFIGTSDVSWVKKEYPYEQVQLIFMDTRYVLNRWKSVSEADINSLAKIIDENSPST